MTPVPVTPTVVPLVPVLSMSLDAAGDDPVLALVHVDTAVPNIKNPARAVAARRIGGT